MALDWLLRDNVPKDHDDLGDWPALNQSTTLRVVVP
jgi:hypothetical protein